VDQFSMSSSTSSGAPEWG